ncbi:Gfo/Idh/MocA family protein [Thalassoroseus pseudoceratinae]|uniref:Gfo/Idh/MocA family protein n=1 Tax=Thalassoroseus pseudoceratinae TaxID=2713176 RepID=UPI001F0F11DE|nr:Gfo/Idh/MocA family oxidoreductase [Thalassoroseus pseudoceratinae]
MNSPPADFLDLHHLPQIPRCDDVRIGCVGSGFIMADCHLVAYRQHGLQPVAISSKNPHKAQDVADRHEIPLVYDTYKQLLTDSAIEVLDIAVPPDVQPDVIRDAANYGRHLKGILAQKPLGRNYAEALELATLCENAGITLAVNQNMRFDHSVRAAKHLLNRGDLGDPVVATLDMRAIPHWMPWQKRQGWVTLRIMSIHHLDTFRYWFGEPQRVYASVRPDPRTQRQFPHEDGIAMYILEYASGLRVSSWDNVWTGPDFDWSPDEDLNDIGIRWRIDGTNGIARGTIGWPAYPERQPSTLDFATDRQPGQWWKPRWNEVWFPDAFIGPMADLLSAISEDRMPMLNARDNLRTVALVDACYESARQHRAIDPREISED